MKILAVSDRVLDKLYSGQARQMYSDVELIIGCGDLPFYYLDFLTSAVDAPLVYVRGNHDSGPQYAGLQGSMRYKAHAEYMYSESEMRVVAAQMVPRLLWNRQRVGRALDILVTHSPPYGIHDRSDLPHTGFKVFLSFLRMFKPRYHLHGHVHIYRQDEVVNTRYGETDIINVYPYKVLDVT